MRLYIQPVFVTFAQAQTYIVPDLADYQPIMKAPQFNFGDGTTVEQAMLAELGLPFKYALDPTATDYGQKIATESYPQTSAISDPLTPQKLWENTPAFKEQYISPAEMLAALQLAQVNRKPPLTLPADGTWLTFTEDNGVIAYVRMTAFGPQVWRP